MYYRKHNIISSENSSNCRFLLAPKLSENLQLFIFERVVNTMGVILSAFSPFQCYVQSGPNTISIVELVWF